MARLSVESTEYVHSTVTADQDVTGDPVQWAFTTRHAWPDATTTWVDGEWVPGAGGTAVARLLVGPAGHELVPDSYSVWLRITDSPERPVKFVGYLTIT